MSRSVSSPVSVGGGAALSPLSARRLRSSDSRRTPHVHRNRARRKNLPEHPLRAGVAIGAIGSYPPARQIIANASEKQQNTSAATATVSGRRTDRNPSLAASASRRKSTPGPALPGQHRHRSQRRRGRQVRRIHLDHVQSSHASRNAVQDQPPPASPASPSVQIADAATHPAAHREGDATPPARRDAESITQSLRRIGRDRERGQYSTDPPPNTCCPEQYVRVQRA